MVANSRFLVATKKLSKLAWRLAIDRYRQLCGFYTSQIYTSYSFRCLVNLSYPPHVVALACLYLAALLSSFEQAAVPAPPGLRSADEIARILGERGPWEAQYQARVEDLEGMLAI